MSAVGDAHKRHAEQHHTHPDPAVRELIARAEARGAERERERITDALEALPRAQDEVDDGWVRWGAICALLAEHRRERPVPEGCDGSFVCGARVHEHGCYADEAGFCNHPEDHDEPPKWADLFGAAPGINLCGEPDDVTEGELRAIIRNAISLNDPAATAQWMRDHLHVTRRDGTR